MGGLRLPRVRLLTKHDSRSLFLNPCRSLASLLCLQAVAITILACLAQDPSLVPHLRPTIPHLLKIVGQIRASRMSGV